MSLLALAACTHIPHNTELDELSRIRATRDVSVVLAQVRATIEGRDWLVEFPVSEPLFTSDGAASPVSSFRFVSFAANDEGRVLSLSGNVGSNPAVEGCHWSLEEVREDGVTTRPRDQMERVALEVTEPCVDERRNLSAYPECQTSDTFTYVLEDREPRSGGYVLREWYSCEQWWRVGKREERRWSGHRGPSQEELEQAGYGCKEKSMGWGGVMSAIQTHPGIDFVSGWVNPRAEVGELRQGLVSSRFSNFDAQRSIDSDTEDAAVEGQLGVCGKMAALRDRLKDHLPTVTGSDDDHWTEVGPVR